MLLIRSILSVVAIVAASGLRVCDDCTDLTVCMNSLQLTIHENDFYLNLIRKAHCGFNGSYKVCCSDFEYRSSLPEAKAIGLISRTSAGDDIETHPNIHLLSGECGDLEGNRIFGGSAASLFEFPWLALLAYKVEKSTNFGCEGSVINSRYVLTAAHCIKDKRIVGVRIGDYDTSSPTDCTGDGEYRVCAPKYQDIPVSKTLYHNEYNDLPSIINDIGLLRLVRNVDFSVRNAGPICLPINNKLLKMNMTSENGTIAGWGRTEKQEKSNILLKVEVSIHSPATCSLLIKKNSSSENIENTLCAGKSGNDFCKDDTGGPLMVEAIYNETYKFVQYGIASYGTKKCASKHPGVYTDVRKYMKWILDNIKP